MAFNRLNAPLLLLLMMVLLLASQSAILTVSAASLGREKYTRTVSWIPAHRYNAQRRFPMVAIARSMRPCNSFGKWAAKRPNPDSRNQSNIDQPHRFAHKNGARRTAPDNCVNSHHQSWMRRLFSTADLHICIIYPPQVDAVLNPDCPETLCGHDADQPTLITVVHVRSAGASDAIHQLWDFTGKPSVLIARTSLNASLAIDWTAFMNGSAHSVSFDVAPMYSTCLMLGRVSSDVWLYDGR